MATKQLNVAKVKGTTSSGMQFEMSGNVAGMPAESKGNPPYARHNFNDWKNPKG